jgi:hypothetical protein
MPSRKGKYNEPYHDGLYRFQDQMFIVLGDGTTVEKKEKKPSPIIYQAQDKYPDPSSHSRSKSKEAKEEAHYLYGQNGKKNPLETP